MDQTYLESIKYVEALKQTLEQDSNVKIYSEMLEKIDQLKSMLQQVHLAKQGLGLIDVILKPDCVY